MSMVKTSGKINNKYSSELQYMTHREHPLKNSRNPLPSWNRDLKSRNAVKVFFIEKPGLIDSKYLYYYKTC